MRRPGTTLAELGLAGAGLAGTVGTAQGATAASATAASESEVCETGWGSLEKHLWSADDHKPPLTNIRTGQHECLGVRARLPFRVPQSGDHLIVDVAHSWNATS